MPKPARPSPRPPQQRRTPAPRVGQSSAPPETVDPRWLLRTLGFVFLAALVCGYLALGLLFVQGSWQLVMHPTHGGTELPPKAVEVRFAPDEAGRTTLNGALVPAVPGGRLSAYTVLLCRDADGQMGTADAPQTATLHSLGAALFAFDYRGFGGSAPAQPSERTMDADAEQAWQYLTGTRGVPADRILLMGSGLGSLPAAQLAAAHPDAAALLLRNADADAFARILHDPRGRMYPLRLLLHDRYDLATALARVKQPKLLLSVGADDASRTAAYRNAPDPKLLLALPHDDTNAEAETLRRFVDDRLP